MTFFSSLKQVIMGAKAKPGMRTVTPARPVKKGTAVASALRVAAARAPTTPIRATSARGWKGAAAAYRGGGGAGAGARRSAEFFDDDDLPASAPDDDGDGDTDDGAELGSVDVYRRHFSRMQLSGWTDDLAKIGVDLAKGAASGALTTVARGLSPTVAPKAPPPPPPGMSTTAKLAIGAAVAVPVLYLLTRKRSAATPVAA